jgi:hypothetical protein
MVYPAPDTAPDVDFSRIHSHWDSRNQVDERPQGQHRLKEAAWFQPEIEDDGCKGMESDREAPDPAG